MRGVCVGQVVPAGAGHTERLGEVGVRLPVDLRIAQGDLDVEVVTHLVDESDVLPGELARRAFQRPQMRSDELDTVSRETAGQFGAQFAGTPCELHRVRGRGVLDLRTQRRITGERVDESFFEAIEGQSEAQVLGDERRGHQRRRRGYRRHTGRLPIAPSTCRVSQVMT